MKYMGSKNRHAKELLPIILKDRRPGQCYVEPFVGGCNMIDKVGGIRVGNDIDIHLISLFRYVVDGGVLPDYICEATYAKARNDAGAFELWEIGWIAFGCSYNGKKFGGFAGKIVTKEGTHRNYQDECKRNLYRQAENLKGVRLGAENYWELIHLPEQSIIYCDPPYEGTTKYKDTPPFDYDLFWQWCRNMTEAGHQVFISEYNAPADFECVWEKKVNNSLTKDTGSKMGVEKLFVYKAEGLDLARG